MEETRHRRQIPASIPCFYDRNERWIDLRSTAGARSPLGQEIDDGRVEVEWAACSTTEREPAMCSAVNPLLNDETIPLGTSRGRDLADRLGELIRDRAIRYTGETVMRLSPLLFAGILALTPAESQAAGLNPFGPSGLPLNRQDYKNMAEAVNPLLNDETIPLGTSRGWANSGSGNSGTITLIDRFETNFQGTKLPCRKLRYHVTIRNRSDPYNLLIDRCRVADGSWKLF